MSSASDADVPFRRDLAQTGRYRALSRVASGLVHELRGPLNSVHLNLELAKSLAGSVDEETGDKLRRYLGVVEEELDRFQSRFDRFVGHVFPPGEGGEGEIDLRRTVEEVGELLKVQARQERASLEVETPGEPVPVRGNAEALRDALLQMAVYGLADEPAAGRTLRLSLMVAGGEARVTVCGSGPAADVDDLLPTTARTLWESQGGTVTIRSGGEDDCTFSMNLPLRESHARDE